jgi:hypothetical protein
MKHCLEALRSSFNKAEVIYRRRDRIVIRWRAQDLDGSIIIKMWARDDLKGKLRRLLRIAACNHEWRNLRRLSSVNMAVPRPLGFCRVVPSIEGYADVLFMEDLGECETATDHLKRLIGSGQEQEVLRFENVMIEMTEQILEAGMLDVDHGLVNMVVPSSGLPKRLDTELARRVIWPALFSDTYGHMLGRLIGLYAFAVQPEVYRATQFAARLCDRLRPPRRALRRASAHVRSMMRTQLENTGIDTRLVLPWD